MKVKIFALTGKYRNFYFFRQHLQLYPARCVERSATSLSRLFASFKNGVPSYWEPCGRRQDFVTKLALGVQSAENTKMTETLCALCVLCGKFCTFYG